MQNKNNFFINNGIYCVNVYGSYYKMGNQLGNLLKGNIKGSIIDFFDRIIFKEINKGIIPNSIKFNSYLNKIPEFVKDELKGFSEATSLDFNKLCLYHILPEIIHNKIYKKHELRR